MRSRTITLVTFIAGQLIALPATARSSTSMVAADSIRFARTAVVRSLADSVQREPGRADLWLELGRICFEDGATDRARQAFERASRCASFDPAVWLELARAWKRDWLYSAERTSLDSAQVCCARACRATPGEIEAWTLFASLAILRGHPLEALEAALRARALDPENGEALLVTGGACDRLGLMDLADSAFARARAHLPPALLEHFDGLPGERGEVIGGDAARAAWAASDPDLTTPENEARLDYLTRLALASVLFREGDAIRWDLRADLFVQYGPPSIVEYNPAAAQVGKDELSYVFPRRAIVYYAPDPLPYPYNMQVWRYPNLGIVATLWDRSLSQHYDLPVRESVDPEPHPSPALMAKNGYVGVPGSLGAFRASPPGSRPLAVREVISRFPGPSQPRVLASVFAAGADKDSLVAAWAVEDAHGRVIERDRQPLSRSWCDPDRTRFTTFERALPAGDYRLDLSVRGTQRLYGVEHLRVHVDPTPASLVMSDLVVLCGTPLSATAADGVRLEPDPDSRASGPRGLTVYYELDHLVVEPGGGCRYAYTYEVWHAHPGSSAAPVLQATREESFVGGLRRQFVTIPVADLRYGDYELRMTVRDLVAGTQVTRSAPFSRD